MRCARRDVLFLCTEPSNVTLLPHACLALTPSLLFFSPANLPGELSLSDVDQHVVRRDGTFFDLNTGALSAYMKGLLTPNAAWAAWNFCPPVQLVRSLSLFLVINIF